MAIDATTTSIQSSGSAMREQAIYMDSYEAKLNQLKAEFSAMALEMGDDFLNDAILNVMEFGRITIDTVGKVMDTFGALPTAFAGIGLFFDKKFNIGDKLFGFINDSFGTKSQGLITSFKDSFNNNMTSIQNATQMAMMGSGKEIGLFQTSLNSLKAAGMTVTQGIAGAFSSMGQSIKAVVSSISKILVPMLMFAAVGKFIEMVSENTRKAREAQDEFNDRMEFSSTTIEKYGGSLDGLIDEYEALRAEHAQLGDEMDVERLGRYNELTNELGEMMPGVVDYIDESGQMHLKNADAIRESANELENLMDIQEQMKAVNMQDNLNEINKQFSGDLLNDGLNNALQVWQNDVKAIQDDSILGGAVRSLEDFVNKKDRGSSDSMYKAEIKRNELMLEYNAMWSQVSDIIAESTVAQLKQNDSYKQMTSSAEGFIKKFANSDALKIDFDDIMAEDNASKRQQMFEDQQFEIKQKTYELGEYVAQAYSKITENVSEETAGQMTGIMDRIINELPSDFFDGKSMTSIKNMFSEISDSIVNLDSAEKISEFRKQLEALGFTTEQANDIIYDLGDATDSTAVRQAYLRGELEGTEESIGNINEAIEDTLSFRTEGSNPIMDIYGIGQGEMDNLMSHLNTLQAFMQFQGEGWENTETGSNLLDGLASGLNMSKESIVQNMEEIMFYMEGFANSTLEKNEETGEWIVTTTGDYTDEQQQIIRDALISMRENNVDVYDWLVQQFGVITDASAESTQAYQDMVDKINSEGLQNENFADYFNALQVGLEEVNGSVIVTTDEFGNLQLQLRDGSSSPFLDTLNQQLIEQDENLKLVYDSATGTYKVLMVDADGNETVVAQLNKQSLDAKTALDMLTTQYEQFKATNNSGDKSAYLAGINHQLEEVAANAELTFEGGVLGMTGTLTPQEQAYFDELNRQLDELELTVVGTTQHGEQMVLIFQDSSGKQFFYDSQGNVVEYTEKVEEATEATKEFNEVEPEKKELHAESNVEEEAQKGEQALDSLDQKEANPEAKLESDVESESSEVSKKVDEMDNLEANPHVDLDSSDAETKSTKIESAIRGISNQFAKPRIEVQGGAQEEAQAVNEELDKTNGKSVDANINIKTVMSETASGVAGGVDAIKKLFSGRDESNTRSITATVEVNAKTDGVDAVLDSITQKVDAINKKSIVIKSAPNINVALITTLLQNLMNKIDSVNQKYVKIQALPSTGLVSTMSAIDLLSTKISELNNRFINIRVSPVTLIAIQSIVNATGTLNSKIIHMGAVYNNILSIMNATGLSWRQIQTNTFRATGSSILSVVSNAFTQLVSRYVGMWGSFHSVTNTHRGVAVGGIRQTTSAMLNAFSQRIRSFSGIASLIPQYIANGILSRQSVVINAVTRVANNAMARFRRRINSSTLASAMPTSAYVSMGSSVPTAMASTATYQTVNNITNAYQSMSSNADGMTSGASNGNASGNLIVNGLDNMSNKPKYSLMASKNEIPDLYTKTSGIDLARSYRDDAITKVNAILKTLTKNTSKYRAELNELAYAYRQVGYKIRDEYNQLQKRQDSLAKSLYKLRNVSSHTKTQREQYNKYMQEYESNNERLKKLEIERIQNRQNAFDTELDIFTDFIEEISAKQDEYIDKISYQLDNVNFDMDVLSYIDPDNTERMIHLQEEQLSYTYQLASQHYAKLIDLRKAYNDAVRKTGRDSERSKIAFDAMVDAEEAYEDAYLKALKLDDDLKKAQSETVEENVKNIRDSYSTIQSITKKAYDAEISALEDLKNQKSEYYDDEISRINEVYDTQRKQRDEAKNEAEYQKELAELSQKRAELMNKISLSQRDTSLEGRKYTADLKKQLTELSEEIADVQLAEQDRLYDLEMDKQEQLQVDRLKSLQDSADSELQQRIDILNREAKETDKILGNKIDDDSYWAQLQDDYLTGNTSALLSQARMMESLLGILASGDFSSISGGFHTLSSETQSEIIDDAMNDIMALLKQQLAVNENLEKYIGDSSIVRGPYDAGKTNMFGSIEFDYKDWRGHEGFDIVFNPNQRAQSSNKSTGSTSKRPNTQNRTHTIGRNDTLWDLAWKYYGNPYKWKNIAEANNNIDPRKLYPGQKLIIPFDTGGYTGSWADNDGRLALLHQKELVLNETQTQDMLNAIKLTDGIVDKLPKLRTPNNTTTNSNDESIYIESLTVEVKTNTKNPRKVGDEIAEGLIRHFKRK